MPPRGSVKPKYGPEADQEIASLKHKIDDLQFENHGLREFCIEQHKEIEMLRNRTGWDQFRDSLVTLGNHRISDAIDVLQQLRDQDEERDTTNEDVSVKIRSPTKTKRNSTIPSSTTLPEFKLQELARPLRRVDSVLALAEKFGSLFKRNKEGKAKEKVIEEDIAESIGEDPKDRAWGVIADWHEQRKLEEERKKYEEGLAKERELRHKREPKIEGEHEQVSMGWKLEDAQAEYRRSAEKEKETPAVPARNPARKESRKNLNGRQGGGRDSRQVEEELIAAMEKAYLANPNNRSTRTVNMPGSKITGSIFEGPAHPHPPHPAVNQPVCSQDYDIPPPRRAAPAVPHQTRTRKAKPPTPPPGPESDDVFAFSRSAVAPQPADQQPVRVLRHRRSAPTSPTPRFVAHRSLSPSPGGNEPIPEIPAPGWLRNWDERREKRLQALKEMKANMMGR